MSQDPIVQHGHSCGLHDDMSCFLLDRQLNCLLFSNFYNSFEDKPNRLFVLVQCRDRNRNERVEEKGDKKRITFLYFLPQKWKRYEIPTLPTNLRQWKDGLTGPYNVFMADSLFYSCASSRGDVIFANAPVIFVEKN